MSVKKRKAEKQKLYDLGWYEDDNYKWRCKSCHELKNLVDCSCETWPSPHCEWCAGREEKKVAREVSSKEKDTNANTD